MFQPARSASASAPDSARAWAAAYSRVTICMGVLHSALKVGGLHAAPSRIIISPQRHSRRLLPNSSRSAAPAALMMLTKHCDNVGARHVRRVRHQVSWHLYGRQIALSSGREVGRSTRPRISDLVRLFQVCVQPLRRVTAVCRSALLRRLLSQWQLPVPVQRCSALVGPLDPRRLVDVPAAWKPGCSPRLSRDRFVGLALGDEAGLLPEGQSVERQAERSRLFAIYHPHRLRAGRAGRVIRRWVEAP